MECFRTTPAIGGQRFRSVVVVFGVMQNGDLDAVGGGLVIDRAERSPDGQAVIASSYNCRRGRMSTRERLTWNHGDAGALTPVDLTRKIAACASYSAHGAHPRDTPGRQRRHSHGGATLRQRRHAGGA